MFSSQYCCVIFSNYLLILGPLFWTPPVYWILRIWYPKLSKEYLCRIYQYLTEQENFTHYKPTFTTKLGIYLSYNFMAMLISVLFVDFNQICFCRIAPDQPFLILVLCSWFFAPQYRIFHFTFLDCVNHVTNFSRSFNFLISISNMEEVHPRWDCLKINKNTSYAFILVAN